MNFSISCLTPRSRHATGHEAFDVTDDKQQEETHNPKKINVVVDDDNVARPLERDEKVIDETISTKAPNNELVSPEYGEYLGKYGEWIRTHSRQDGMVVDPRHSPLRVWSGLGLNYIDPNEFTFDDYLDWKSEKDMELMCAGGGCAGAVGVSGAGGFRSFSAFKRALGRAGTSGGSKLHWHHVVEQTPGNVARFGGQAVHNPGNMIKVTASVHGKISGYYSSVQPSFTGSLTVRQWLSTQSFAAQAAFGNETLRKFGVIR